MWPEGRRGHLFTRFSTTKFSITIIRISIDVLREGKEPPSVIFTIFFVEGVIFTSLKRGKGTLTACLSRSHQTSARSICPGAQCKSAWHFHSLVGMHVSNPTMGHTHTSRPAVAFLIRICIDRYRKGKPCPSFLTHYILKSKSPSQTRCYRLQVQNEKEVHLRTPVVVTPHPHTVGPARRKPNQGNAPRLSFFTNTWYRM